MSAPLTDDPLKRLQADGLPRIAAQLGIDPAQADEAGAALPLLLGADAGATSCECDKHRYGAAQVTKSSPGYYPRQNPPSE